MTEDQRNKRALFKYSIISGLVSGIETYPTKSEYFRKYGDKKYKNEIGKVENVSYGSVERWYYNYMAKGLDGLKPQKRTDEGITRKLDSDLMDIINHYLETHPRLPATAIYEALIHEKYIEVGTLSLSTISRYIRRYKKEKKIVTTKEMRRYEAEHINDIWCCDTSYSFHLNVGGKKQRTYIIAILDDASRMIVGADVFFNDNYVNYMEVLKGAVSKYGKPRLLNLDNGAPYKNGQIELLGARLGITLHHCAPYEPQSKAKIERFFRTLKDHFMAIYHLTSKTTLDEFRADLNEYIVNYNNSVHSSIGITPNERFFNGEDQTIKVDPKVIETSFLLELERKVSPDAVIIINNIEFEVPYEYSKKKIKLRYSQDYKRVYVVEADGTLIPIHLLDKIANSKIQRKHIVFNTEEN